ncbi:IS1/IS1595 family N-terminal zinc-binding domain-containing protein [Neorickettsia helminthoeca]|nr:helix-turn-helix domain-containing protein [Neorickettsia helminthoeca]
MHCPKCSSTKFIKSGTVNAKQRYKCLECKCQFTKSEKQGAQLRLKMHAVQLFLSGVSMNSVAKLFDLSPPTIMRWVNQLKELMKDDFPTEFSQSSEKSTLEMIYSTLESSTDVVLTHMSEELLCITLKKIPKMDEE